MRVKKIFALLVPSVMIGSGVAAVFCNSDHKDYMKATDKEIYVMNK